MKNLFTVPQVPGSKRTSPRNYTHAVIGHFNHDKRIKQAAVLCKTDISNHNYSLMQSKMNAGDIYRSTYADGSPCQWPMQKETIDRAKEYINKYPTVEAMVAGRVKGYEDEKALYGGKFIVLRWSQSFKNASKGLSEFTEYYLDVQVVETVKIK